MDGHNQPYCSACKVAVRTCSILHTEIYDVSEADMYDLTRGLRIAEADVELQHAFQREFAEGHPDMVWHIFKCPGCGLQTMPAPHTTRLRCYRCGERVPIESGEREVRMRFRHLRHGLVRAEGNAAKWRARVWYASNKSESWMDEQLGQNSLTGDTEWVRKYLNGDEM